LSASIFANSLESPLGTSPLAVMIMGIIVTSSCLHICLISTAKSLYLCFFSLYFSWLLWSLGTALSIRKFFFYFINQSYIWSVVVVVVVVVVIAMELRRMIWAEHVARMILEIRTKF
jgi:hypothetical protein